MRLAFLYKHNSSKTNPIFKIESFSESWVNLLLQMMIDEFITFLRKHTDVEIFSKKFESS